MPGRTSLSPTSPREWRKWERGPPAGPLLKKQPRAGSASPGTGSRERRLSERARGRAAGFELLGEEIAWAVPPRIARGEEDQANRFRSRSEMACPSLIEEGPHVDGEVLVTYPIGWLRPPRGAIVRIAVIPDQVALLVTST